MLTRVDSAQNVYFVYFTYHFRTPAEINGAPSPRVLNCHYPLKYLPTQLFEKKTKIVHVYRNPKDVAVSFYYHASSIVKRMKEPPFQTFSEFLPFITGEYGVCK